MALTTNVSNAIPQAVSYVSNGMSADIVGVKFPLQKGVPYQNLYMFKVIPASSSSVSISAMNTFQAEGQPLNQRNTGTDNNVSSIALNISNFIGVGSYNPHINGILLDCERTLVLTASASTTQSFTWTVTGFDYLGTAVTHSQNCSSGQTQYTMLQPFSIITSCILSQSPGVSVSIGSGNGIGLPYYLTNISNIVSMTSGATVTPANNWRVTNTTATTSPTRGFITPSSAPNGTTLLNICYYVYGSDSEMNAELNNANQSALRIASIQHGAATAQNVLPLITRYDLTGVVYPGDSDFIRIYSQAKLS